MAFLVTTTGTLSPVVLDDLGARSLTHPTVDLDLEIEFEVEELRESADLQAAINSGYITIQDEFGNNITDLSSADDIKVKTSPTDDISGYLEDKIVEGSAITITKVPLTNGAEALEIAASSAALDIKDIKISIDDTAPGFLEDKITVTPNKLIVTTTSPGGNEKLNFTIGSDIFDKSGDTTDNITEGITKLFFTDERVDDRVSNLIKNGTGLSWVYDDNLNTLTGNIQNNTTTQRVRVSDTGTLIGTRQEINFIAGSNVSLTVADNVGSDRVDVTINSTIGNHNLLSTVHSDTTAASVVRGDLIVGQGVSTTWSRLAIGGSGTFLKSDGTDATWQSIVEADISDLQNYVKNGGGVVNQVAYWTNGNTISGSSNFTFDGSTLIVPNLTVNGTTTTVDSTVTTIADPIITLGEPGSPAVDDNKDRGIEFKYVNGTEKVGFFGYDDSTGYFTFIPDATNTSEVITGTKGIADLSGVITGTIQITTGATNGYALISDASGNGNWTQLTTSLINNFGEDVDDRVAGLIQNGTGISWTYNDPANTLTANIAGLTVSEFASANISQWTNDSGYISSIGTFSIDSLTDVDTTTVSPAIGDRLEWDGTNWVPVKDIKYVSIGSSRNKTTTNRYLDRHDKAPTNNAPYLIPYNATIYAVSAIGKNVQTWNAEIRVDSGTGFTTVYTLPITAAKSAYIDNISININAGDKVAMYVSGSSIEKPTIDVFIKSR